MPKSANEIAAQVEHRAELKARLAFEEFCQRQGENAVMSSSPKTFDVFIPGGTDMSSQMLTNVTFSLHLNWLLITDVANCLLFVPIQDGIVIEPHKEEDSAGE